jgi:hypothetical protein
MLRLRYIDQPVHAVLGNNLCLVRGPYKIKGTLCGQNAEF